MANKYDEMPVLEVIFQRAFNLSFSDIEKLLANTQNESETVEKERPFINRT